MFVSVRSPVSRGGVGQVTVSTKPLAACTIVVTYKSGPSGAQGLGPKDGGRIGQRRLVVEHRHQHDAGVLAHRRHLRRRHEPRVVRRAVMAAEAIARSSTTSVRDCAACTLSPIGR
ncbi:MAG TPA: hypothetical protein VFA01_01225 [Candidatus Dormibacteraeota bacterium]|nr:hypothetical protein [Candidatus Dormibacteraeota bacterium]